MAQEEAEGGRSPCSQYAPAYPCQCFKTKEVNLEMDGVDCGSSEKDNHFHQSGEMRNINNNNCTPSYLS